MLRQLRLFLLSNAKPIGRPTRPQLVLLDLIALRDGTPLGEVAHGTAQTLRKLLAKRLVECVALGPAIYVLTPIGRVARGRK